MHLTRICSRRWQCAVMLLASGAWASAQDWPQWRGPKRDGRLTDFTAPQSWPDKLTKRWSIAVGVGHSSPVVAGGSVFVFARQDDQEVVGCFDRATGRQLWRKSYPAAYEMNSAATAHGKGPKATPVLAGGCLFTFGISGILSCYDARTGKRKWHHEFSQRFAKTSPLFGTASSPIVVDGLCIAHVGGHGSGALRAFDAKTGRVRWSWDGDGPGYTSPIVATLDGTRQLVTQSQQFCLGLSLSDGTLLWKIPYTTQFTMNIVAPLPVGNLVIFSGYKRGTTAYEIGHRAGKWTTQQRWHSDEISMFMSSPVFGEERIFGFSQRKKGQLFCLDPRTGKTLWTSDGRVGKNAALLIGKGVLLVLTTNAELIVAGLSDKRYEEIVRYKVAQTPTWAHPAVVGKEVFIKDLNRLSLWEIGTE